MERGKQQELGLEAGLMLGTETSIAAPTRTAALIMTVILM